MIKRITTLVIVLMNIWSFAQSYVSSFEEIEEQQMQERRNVVVFVHTDWCAYCDMMEKSTFEDEEVQELIQSKVYFTELDADTKEDIAFANHVFKFKPTGYDTGVHELAEALAQVDGKLSYPTLTILNPKNEIIFQHAGYIKPKEMKEILSKL